MQQTVVVQSVEGDQAWVLGTRESSCSSCAGKASCATLGSWNAKPVRMRVHNTMGAAVGDEVVVEVPDRFVLTATWRLYGQPMLAFLLVGLACRAAGQAMGWHEIDALAAVGGIVAVAAYYLFGRHRWLAPRDAASDWAPHIVDICKHHRGMHVAR